MRFLTLLRKELRESLPWMLLAAVALFVIGGLNLWKQTIPWNIENRYSLFEPAENVYQFQKHSTLWEAGSVLFITSIGLGLVLGVRQFWVENFLRTWSFVFHRSVKRQTILWVKLAAAGITFFVSLGIIWSIFYWYAWRPGFFAVPPTARVFIEGWIYIILGFIIYLGTALAGLSRAKWYTTKIFGVAFAVFILVVVTVQWNLAWAFTVIVAGILVLLSQIIDLFLSREF